jgi:hypothetical protein
VMRNIEILSRVDRSALLRTIQDSNEKKIEREASNHVQQKKCPALSATPKK